MCFFGGFVIGTRTHIHVNVICHISTAFSGSSGRGFLPVGCHGEAV